jgi:hypothetical protein
MHLASAFLLAWQFATVDAFGFVDLKGFVLEKQDFFMHAILTHLHHGTFIF